MIRWSTRLRPLVHVSDVWRLPLIALFVFGAIAQAYAMAEQFSANHM